jgi:hypothetical protein
VPRWGENGGRSGKLTRRQLLRIRQAQLDELHAAGKLGPGELRQDAWRDVASTILEAKSPRTRLMADRMVVDRTDPRPRPVPDTGPAGVKAITVVLAQPDQLTPVQTQGDRGRRPGSLNASGLRILLRSDDTAD